MRITTQGHILVVDDYAMNRLKLSRFLKQEGHTITLAENGKQAVELINEQPFDLMLLDIIMPEMDGYQVLEYMKNHDMLRNMPVIVISALDEMENTIKCITMGAEDYLPKPFDPVLLRARIGACLEKKRLRDQEVEYLKNVTLVTSAASAVETNTFDPETLVDVALRQDELGRLARVFTSMVREVYAREEQLKKAHTEMQTLNQAKTKMIAHLSHELRTPLAIISTSIKLLRKSSLRQNEQHFLSVLDRIDHYLKRLVELGTEANDIAKGRPFYEKTLLENLIRQCQDLLTSLIEDRELPDVILDGLRQRIEDLYPDENYPEQDISLHRWIPDVLSTIRPLHLHRNIRFEVNLIPSPCVRMPESLLRKAFCGLVRNAIENTPDGGTIWIKLYQQDAGLCLEVQDFGVGIDDQLQRQLFHGFIHAGDTQDYSSGNPYEFGAGGQGLDLLRTKLYSERLGFHIRVESRRCIHIQPKNPCPGNIRDCPFCSNEVECQESGGSLFALEFPASMLASDPDNMMKGEDT